MFVRLLAIAMLVFGFAAGGAACESTSHDSIDKWTHTEKGTAKLKKAFADEALDADLSAHAGANLIKKGMDPDVRAALDQMTPGRRTQIVGLLAPRLWEIARLENEMAMPNSAQVQAKDALVLSRKYADDKTKTQIDGYLVDWYCVASYEGRAQVGAVLGASVIRMVGAAAAKKLMSVTDGLIAAPGQGKAHNRLGDELLLGVAVTGSPDAVKYLLQVAHMKTGDETLPTRAMSALYKAYVDPGGLFDIVEATPLVPNLDAIVAIAKDDAMPGGAADDAVKLLKVVGAPACIAPLVGMVGHPHANPRFKYVAADSALKCGGLRAIKDVVHALPDGAYQQEELMGGVVVDITMMTPRPQVLATLRELLADKGRIARWVAIEGLAAMKSVEDIPRLQGISSNEKLVGYWGDQSGVDPKDRKQDPTLGQRAKELAQAIGKAPK
jgi:hypothetical protein